MLNLLGKLIIFQWRRSAPQAAAGRGASVSKWLGKRIFWTVSKTPRRWWRVKSSSSISWVVFTEPYCALCHSQGGSDKVVFDFRRADSHEPDNAYVSRPVTADNYKRRPYQQQADSEFMA
jgi:hypothetical protein